VQKPTSWLLFDNSTRLPITPHLQEGIKALQSLATPFGPQQLQRLWIDAICINQAENNEKAGQIPLMGFVYSSAKRVMAWLSPAADGSDRCIKEMPDFSRKLQDWDRSVLSPSQFQAAGLPGIMDPVWTSFAHLLARPWFNRLWVFQEAVLAKDLLLVCGAQTVAFQAMSQFVDVAAAALLVGRIAEKGPSIFVARGAQAIISITAGRDMNLLGETFDPLRLLDMGREAEATEPVDRIFGLFGVMQADHRMAIDVGYSGAQRKEFWKMYIAAASYEVDVVSGLQILSHAESVERPAMLPSWVPNWNSRRPSESYEKRAQFDAGSWEQRRKSTQTPLWQVLRPSNFLRVRGTNIGLTMSTSPLKFTRVVDATSAAAQLKTINDALEMCKHLCGKNTEVFAERFARTLVTNISRKLKIKYSSNVLEDFRAHQRFLQIWLEGPESWHNPEQSKHVSAYADSMSPTWEHRCFFVTDTSHMGLASQSCRKGDKVCVFLTTKTPFILRPVGKNFTLVSDAYVDGIMYGEALKRDDVELRDFVLE
jgi:hypothetical protein